MREVVRIAPRRPEGYLFAARGLLHESAPLDDVQSLAEKGLSLARTPELKALGWFLMADVYSRRHQPDNVTRALEECADTGVRKRPRIGARAVESVIDVVRRFADNPSS